MMASRPRRCSGMRIHMSQSHSLSAEGHLLCSSSWSKEMDVQVCHRIRRRTGGVGLRHRYAP